MWEHEDNRGRRSSYEQQDLKGKSGLTSRIVSLLLASWVLSLGCAQELSAADLCTIMPPNYDANNPDASWDPIFDAQAAALIRKYVLLSGATKENPDPAMELYRKNCMDTIEGRRVHEIDATKLSMELMFNESIFDVYIDEPMNGSGGATTDLQ